VRLWWLPAATRADGVGAINEGTIADRTGPAAGGVQVVVSLVYLWGLENVVVEVFTITTRVLIDREILVFTGHTVFISRHGNYSVFLYRAAAAIYLPYDDPPLLNGGGESMFGSRFHNGGDIMSGSSSRSNGLAAKNTY